MIFCGMKNSNMRYRWFLVITAKPIIDILLVVHNLETVDNAALEFG